MDRRRFLSALAAGAATPLALWLNPAFAALGSTTPSRLTTPLNTALLRSDTVGLFDLGIASGDPSASGVILWIRLNPSQLNASEPVYVQVANDVNFRDLVVEAQAALAGQLYDRDYTLSVDLDGTLQPGKRYYYRFIHAGIASRTGRCRTSPPASVSAMRFALLTC